MGRCNRIQKATVVTLVLSYIAFVIIFAMLGWMGATALGGAFGLPVRFAFLFDLAALAETLFAIDAEEGPIEPAFSRNSKPPAFAGGCSHDPASVQAVTRVNAEQASKRTLHRPTCPPMRGRLIGLGE